MMSSTSVSSIASDSEGRFAVRNAGMVTCEKFIEEKNKKSPQFNLYMGWIDGYLSAANQFTEKTFDLVPWGNTVLLATLIENHCETNKDQHFYVAVNQLAAAMMKDRIIEHSELIKTEHDGNKTYVYQEVLMRMQKVLKKEKLYRGKPDGKYGQGTRKAIIEFQKSHKLAVTGLPDQLTLYYMFIKLPKL